MSKPESQIARIREDADFFREVVRFTAQVTTFTPRLVEKDYHCTVLLEYLSTASSNLVFKGGTCLSKVHASFYRLSEDLDFVIPMGVDSPRAKRSKQAAALKEAVAALPERLPFFKVIQPLKGANNSTQYNAMIGYTPLAGRDEDTIKIEIGLREPLLFSPLNGQAQTILLDPNSDKALIPPLAVSCISKIEAFAEKFRAALSRREVAVRDFFDLDYAVRRLELRPEDAELIRLVRQKLAVPGNEPADVSANRLAALRQQVEPQLKPVLRTEDFAEFNLERAFQMVADDRSTFYTAILYYGPVLEPKTVKWSKRRSA
jgi:predicted nucleotidyltransferase component of viral defense system